MSWSKQRKIVVVTVFVVVAAIGFVAAYSLSSKSKSTVMTGRPTDNRVIYDIDLRKENKDPVDLLIKKGEYVRFNSKDGGQHQIVQGSHDNTQHGSSALDSGVFNKDEAYLLQFNDVGSFKFHDNYDHDYTMTILVYEPGRETKIQ